MTNTFATKPATSGNRVFVGLSGGVDSAVSAHLLKEEGFAVVGVFIRSWQPDFIPCTLEDDRREAMRVAAYLEIPFLECDLAEAYKRDVVDRMLEGYSQGETPNPDVLCNRDIKFGAFAEWAFANGADYIATGHYARRAIGLDGTPALFEGVDTSKDQTYFLWMVDSALYPRMLFPVGHLKKSDVRTIAEGAGLPNATRKDSQGVCFLGNINMKDFLTHYMPPRPGAVVDTTGAVLGTHDGVHLYTLGERHGLHIPAKSPEMAPYYVVRKEPETNVLTVDFHPRSSNPHPTYLLREVRWHTVPTGDSVTARVRHRGKKICVTVDNTPERTTVTFMEPALVAEGQSVVFYIGEQLIGGGIVTGSVSEKEV